MTHGSPDGRDPGRRPHLGDPPRLDRPRGPARRRGSPGRPSTFLASLAGAAGALVDLSPRAADPIAAIAAASDAPGSPWSAVGPHEDRPTREAGPRRRGRSGLRLPQALRRRAARPSAAPGSPPAPASGPATGRPIDPGRSGAMTGSTGSAPTRPARRSRRRGSVERIARTRELTAAAGLDALLVGRRPGSRVPHRLPGDAARAADDARRPARRPGDPRRSAARGGAGPAQPRRPAAASSRSRPGRRPTMRSRSSATARRPRPRRSVGSSSRGSRSATACGRCTSCGSATDPVGAPRERGDRPRASCG